MTERSPLGPRPKLPGWSYLGPWGALLLAASLLSLSAVGLVAGGPDVIWIVAGVGAVALGPLAACLCARTAAAVGRRERAVWRLLAVAYVMNSLGVLVTAGEMLLVDPAGALVSVADLFWLLYYPFAAAAVLVLSGHGGFGSLRLTSLLDACVLAVGSGAFVWELTQYSLASSATISAPAGILAVAYLFGDLLLLFALISLGLSWDVPRLTVPLGLLIASFALSLAVDFSFLWTVIEGGSSLVGVPTVVWLAVPAMVGWAALSRLGGWSRRFDPPSDRALVPEEQTAPAVARAPGAQRVAWVLVQDRTRRARVLVPYLAFPLVAGFMHLHFARTPPPDVTSTAVAVWVALVMLGLVSLRQYLTLRDNEQLSVSLMELSQGLEEHVEKRTAELAEQSRVLRERTEQVTTLNRVAERISHALTSHEVVTAGLTLSFEATGCSAGAIWLRPVEGGYGLQLVARYGLTPELEETFASLPRSEPAFGAVIATERGGLVRAEASDALHAVGPPGGRDDWALYLAPLVSRGELLGALGLVVEEADVFTETRGQVARSVAAQLAVALENARQYDRAMFLADHDPVSGLLNHRALHARLESELSRIRRTGGRVSLLMVDLDNFKLLNDTYGHPAGDLVLARVAEMLQLTVRGSDVVGRYGGDEFMAVLPDTDSQGAVDVAERLQDALYERPFIAPDGTPVPLLCSVGVATYPDDGRRVDELVAFADVNLYTSKQHGGGTITAGPPPDRTASSPSGVFTVLDGLVTAVDNKDRYTRSHSDNVTELALVLAGRVGVTDESRMALRLAGLLHDVGKIGVPDRILRKPGRLTAEEYEVVKQHAALSELIIKEIPHLDQVVTAVGAHHERFDGTGYPRGLKGVDIPQLGRILAVADAYSAMTTDRPYRKAMTPEEARADLLCSAGTQLDPELVAAFVGLLDEGALANCQWGDDAGPLAGGLRAG